MFKKLSHRIKYEKISKTYIKKADKLIIEIIFLLYNLSKKAFCNPIFTFKKRKKVILKTIFMQV